MRAGGEGGGGGGGLFGLPPPPPPSPPARMKTQKETAERAAGIDPCNAKVVRMTIRTGPCHLGVSFGTTKRPIKQKHLEVSFEARYPFWVILSGKLQGKAPILLTHAHSPRNDEPSAFGDLQRVLAQRETERHHILAHLRHLG